MKLKGDFFNRSALHVAKSLIGCILVHKTEKGIMKAKIVETEAYLQDDPASHSFKGKTSRNQPMFGPSGHMYVYFTYGMHHCFNIVAGKSNGQAVLIRALEPLEGIEIMSKNRKFSGKNLTNGPAKLVQALEIKKEYNGLPLGDKIWIEDKIVKPKIIQTTRIGISQAQDKLYRFYTPSEFVSKQ